MSDNPNQPKEYDAVLGGQNPPPTSGVVLGGIESVKHRLASSDIGAISDFSQLIQINSHNTSAYYSRGVCHLNLEDYEAAIADFSQAIQINPNYLEAYYNRGCCHFDIKDYRAAIADFSQAIQIDSNQVIAYTARGNAHLALGDTTKAELDFQKAMAIKQKLGKTG